MEPFEAEPSTSSLLGLQWNMEVATLEIWRVVMKKVPEGRHKRVLLFFLASVSDPIWVLLLL